MRLPEFLTYRSVKPTRSAGGILRALPKAIAVLFTLLSRQALLVERFDFVVVVKDAANFTPLSIQSNQSKWSTVIPLKLRADQRLKFFVIGTIGASEVYQSHLNFECHADLTLPSLSDDRFLP